MAHDTVVWVQVGRTPCQVAADKQLVAASLRPSSKAHADAERRAALRAPTTPGATPGRPSTLTATLRERSLERSLGRSAGDADRERELLAHEMCAEDGRALRELASELTRGRTPSPRRPSSPRSRQAELVAVTRLTTPTASSRLRSELVPPERTPPARTREHAEPPVAVR
jgi:hypothetical protein